MNSPELQTVDVHIADDRRFAMVPEWLLDSDISPMALRLWCILHRYSDKSTQQAHPARKTLAARLHVKDPKVVDRALVELVNIGAVVPYPRWLNADGFVGYARDDEFSQQTSNGYILNLWNATPPEGSGTTPPEGSRTSPPGGSGATQTRVIFNESHL